MGTYIVRRVLLSIVVLLLITIITFLLLHIMPGDPAAIMLGIDAGPEQIEALRKELWLDRPLVVQYGHWLSNAIQGDLGKSVLYDEDVTGFITARLPVTMHLSLMALVLSAVLGVGAGIICAIRRGRILDSVITLAANIGVAIPIFWLGILGIYSLGLKLGWLPLQGYTSPFDDFWLSTSKAIMPVICLAIPSLALLARQTRSSMLEVVRQDYIRTAWAKGLKERVIVLKHALKNALIPVVTLLGIQLRILVGGSVLVEKVFNVPGMGRLLVDSVLGKDFIMVQACILVIALLVLLANLLVDISYGWLDPRVRYG
ncbi:MAG TPA: ABC transporter permease [Dehalococcoidia bacterium]|nr:ABC transporter permease [Dehalococcoidia bacterium]